MPFFDDSKARHPDQYLRPTHAELMLGEQTFQLDGGFFSGRMAMDYLADIIGLQIEEAGAYLRLLVDDAYADPDVYIDDTGAKRLISEDPRYNRVSIPFVRNQ